MSDTKNVSVIEEEQKEKPTREFSDYEREVVSAVFNKFRNSADSRDRAFENFDGLNLVEYIEDSVHRFTTNVDYREGMEDWQARVHDPFTRNKVVAIQGKVKKFLPIAEFRGRGDEDMRRGQILSNLYEYSEEVDDYDEFMGDIFLEAIVKGTAVGYEGYEHREKAIREVSGSGDKITIKNGVERTNKLYGQLVRLEDFYPSSVGIRRIKDMPYCFWREVMPYQQFLQDYAAYAEASNVEMYSTDAASREDHPVYLDYTSDDTGDGNVEVIKYYNKDVDEYIIIANGVWLNPIMVDGKKEISPLPFNHKELPFWSVTFEPFESTFFYGKSLPDKLKSLQDVLNVLTNMLLDQSFLTVFKPILTNGFDSMEDDYLRPGRRTPVDTQGLSLSEAYHELDMSTPGGWHQFILQYTRKVMEEASVDQLQQGSASGLAERTPATAIRAAAEGVASVLGLFGTSVKYGIKQKALLRARNIMQFWTDSRTPIIEQVLGEGGNEKFNKAFNIFKFDNVTMSDGKRGMKIIEMYADKKDMPTREGLKARRVIHKLNTGKEIEIMAIPGGYIRNFEFDVRVIQNPRTEDTKEVEQAMQLEKVRVYKSFWPNLVDDAELLAQTAEKMGDDPIKIMKPDAIPGSQPDESAQNQMQDKGVNTMPEGNVANNIVRGAQGGEVAANEMQQKQVNPV